MTEIKKDYTIGFIKIKPKWDATKMVYVDSMLFQGFIYKHNPETGEPQISGIRKIKDKQGEHEVPINPIEFSFSIAISSLTKVLSKEARRCNIYWQPKPRSE